MNPFLGRPAPKLRRTWAQRLVLAANFVLISLSLSLAGLLSYANDRAAAVNRVALDRSLAERTEAEAGEQVLNILLVGSDSSANLDPDDPIQIGRDGQRLGDVIIVVHLDQRTGDLALLSLPRDLWVPIAGSQREDRINRAFLVGGPATLIDTIDEQFGIPIHHYVNVDFAGFQGLVEAVGSVEVHFDRPARDWNINAWPEPRSQTGFSVETAGCHALGPEQALAYVRSRYYQTQDVDGTWVTDPTSDLGRIRRQQDFLQRLIQTAIDQGARNPLVLADLIDAGIQHVAIDQDLTPALLIDLSTAYRSFEPGSLQTYTYPAEDTVVGDRRVLIPLHDQAEPLINLFGGARFDDPDTVDLTVVASPREQAPEIAIELDSPALQRPVEPGPSPAAIDVVDALAVTGFDVSPRTVELDPGLEPGIVVRHGPDGRSAAEMVAAVIAPAGIDGAEVRLAEVGYLRGRNLVVAVGPSPVEAPVDPATEAPADGPAVDQPLEEVAGPGPVVVAEGQDSAETSADAADDPEAVELAGDDPAAGSGSAAPEALQQHRDTCI